MDTPTEQVTEQVTAQARELPPIVAEALEGWFAKHFHNLGPMLDTPVYNLLHAAKDDLRAVLAAVLH